MRELNGWLIHGAHYRRECVTVLRYVSILCMVPSKFALQLSQGSNPNLYC